MTEAIQKINFQNFTKLPIKELVKTDKEHNEIVVETPHKGQVIIPMIEGWLFKTEKDAEDIVYQLKTLEYEAMKFLLDNWISTPNPTPK